MTTGHRVEGKRKTESPTAEVARYKAASRLEQEQPIERTQEPHPVDGPRGHKATPLTVPVPWWPWFIFSILGHLFPHDGSLILKLLFLVSIQKFLNTNNEYNTNTNMNIIYESLLMAHAHEMFLI